VKTVLIVDDEYALVAALEMVLSSAGYRTAARYEGTSLVDTALKIRPDLILLDVMLPGITGLEALLLLRSRLDLRNLPVIMMSGAYPTERHREYGWSHWLDKPFPFDSLLAVTERLIGPGEGMPRSS
jgi:DNA-binding response OmpR family regulator